MSVTLPIDDLTPRDLTGLLWGDALPNPALNVEVEASRSLMSPRVTCSLTITFPDGKRKTSRETYTHPKDASSPLRDGVVGHVRRMGSKQAPYLYELDPRRGLLIGEAPDRFPQSPLFDPPELQGDLRRYLCLGLGDEVWRQDLAELSPQERLARRVCTCAFCGTRVGLSGLWGGGNIGFVHAPCYPGLPVNG